jgi:hypothetical protein
VDGAPWKLYHNDHRKCWGDDIFLSGFVPYVVLGSMAGFLMGFAACGLLATALSHWFCICHHRAHSDGSQNTGQTNTEYEIVAIKAF